VPIAYCLDLAPRPASAEPSSRRVLVVADPTGDLAAASREADEVERRLTADGWTASALRGPTATRAAVIAGLADVTLFHYAGHGSRGAEAWDAALRLADDTDLRSGDILILPRVPARVVLAGCHTGRRDALSLAGGMNLGRAFVLAGAEAVLVADAEVDDRATRRLSEALYADPTIDLATALRRAQLRLRDEGVPDWATFRVLVP
jgi:cellulose synthase operon protein C